MDGQQNTDRQPVPGTGGDFQPLANGSWSIWSGAVLRGAGFPPDGCWLTDRHGARYACELRLVVTEHRDP
jgi:hypothetical protein